MAKPFQLKFTKAKPTGPVAPDPIDVDTGRGPMSVKNIQNSRPPLPQGKSNGKK